MLCMLSFIALVSSLTLKVVLPVSFSFIVIPKFRSFTSLPLRFIVIPLYTNSASCAVEILLLAIFALSQPSFCKTSDAPLRADPSLSTSVISILFSAPVSLDCNIS